jgi:hypothetical protein
MASDDTTGNDMQAKIREHMEAKSTEELQNIVREDNRAECSN